jgi:AI-2 transport protein TqsA
MERAREPSPAVRTIVASAAVVIMLGGLKLASGLLSPIIFAIFLAVLCLPILRWLQRKGLPTWAALLLLIVGVLALGAALILFIFLSLGQVRDSLPAYQAQLAALRGQIEAWLARFDVDLTTTTLNLIDPATVINTITGLLSQAINGLVLALLILVGVVFTMLESKRFGDKLRAGLGTRHPLATQLARFSTQAQQFFYLRTINNLIVAAGSAVFLIVMQVDFALLWAVLIFFLSYIPNIGIIVACIPAVALALLQHGLVAALVVAVGLTVINYIGDYAITPRLMSQGLGLSQFTVFFSFFVWAYIFGAIGGLLSVPLTLLVKLLLEMSDGTRWLAVLMDDTVPAAPAASDTLAAREATRSGEALEQASRKNA